MTFAVASTLLIAASSAAIDMVALGTAHSKMQDVADAAALYAVREIAIRNLSDSGVQARTEDYIDSLASVLPQGLDPSATITVQSRDPARVTVALTASAALPFGVLVRDGEVSVEAEAVESDRLPVSLLLLNPAAPQVWKVGGTSDVISVEGVAHVNSQSGAALYGSGDATVKTKATLVAGPDQAAANWIPAPSFGAAPLPDPWKDKITWPEGGTCNATNLQVKNTTAALSPGTYCGGLSIRTHGVARLSPGVYVLKDGDLEVDSGSVLEGLADVTLVLIGDAGAIDIQSGAEVTLVAPKSGDWAGLAIAVNPQPTKVSATIIGGGELKLDGVVYMPSAKLTITGGGDATSLTGTRVFVVDSLEMSGNGQILLRGDSDLLSEPTGSRLVR